MQTKPREGNKSINASWLGPRIEAVVQYRNLRDRPGEIDELLREIHVESRREPKELSASRNVHHRDDTV